MWKISLESYSRQPVQLYGANLLSAPAGTSLPLFHLLQDKNRWVKETRIFPLVPMSRQCDKCLHPREGLSAPAWTDLLCFGYVLPVLRWHQGPAAPKLPALAPQGCSPGCLSSPPPADRELAPKQDSKGMSLEHHEICSEASLGGTLWAAACDPTALQCSSSQSALLGRVWGSKISRREQIFASLDLLSCSLRTEPVFLPPCPPPLLSARSLSPRLGLPFDSCHFMTPHASLCLCPSSKVQLRCLLFHGAPQNNPISNCHDICQCHPMTIIIYFLVLLNYLFSSAHAHAHVAFVSMPGWWMNEWVHDEWNHLISANPKVPQADDSRHYLQQHSRYNKPADSPPSGRLHSWIREGTGLPPSAGHLGTTVEKKGAHCHHH